MSKNGKLLVVTMMILALACVSIISACQSEAAKRAEMREKLDDEFEKDTEKIIDDSKVLMEEIKNLQVEHVELDKRHQLLDAAVKNAELSKEDQQIQQRHDIWDVEHKKLIEDSLKVIKDLNARHELHEEMEKKHEDVPIEQLKKDHEQFEQELKEYKKKLDGFSVKLKEAKKQMQIIIKEHDSIYGKKK